MFPNLLYLIRNISEYIRHVCKTVLDLQGPVYQTKEVFHSVQCNLLILKHVCVCVQQTEVRECLLLFGAESSVIQVAVQKFKDQVI